MNADPATHTVKRAPPAQERPGATWDPGLDWRLRMTGLALLNERMLPAALPAVGVIAGFFTLAWLGAFTMLEPLGRACAVLAIAALLIFALAPLLWLRLPTAAEIQHRLDTSRPELHRPLATLADRPADGADPIAIALWREHRRRADRASLALEAAAGDPRLRDRDRFAMRAALVAALIGSAFAAGDEKSARLAVAFDWSKPRVAPVPPRLDAWIDPPAYTGRPPIFLSNIPAGEEIRAPAGSILSIRSTASRIEGREVAAPMIVLQHGAGLEIPKVEVPKAEVAANVAEKRPVAPTGVALERRVLRGDGIVRILQNEGEVAAYSLIAIPDLAPKVTLKEAKAESASPDRNTRAGIRVAYTFEDDYGIAKAELVIERRVGARGRTLFPPPTATLPLRVGEAFTLVETEDHPWAGEEVRVRIKIEDDLGQSAESDTLVVSLPQRPFTQALARALVEQRRNLNFSPDDRARLRLAFDALLFEPDRYASKVGDFLALDMIRTALRNARKDERLREISDEMLDLALAIENGDMTEAEKRLREAEARLREAIDRDASPEEIKRLAEELRRAMDQFLREFAERALRDRDQNAQDRPQISPDRMLSQRDLNDMLRKIEEMARSGNTAEAKRLLDQLRQTLENLRSARRQEVDPTMRELGRQIEELDRLQREQRDLRDRTFREGQQQQRQNRQRQQGQQGQQGQQDQNQQGQRGRQRGQQQQGDGEGEMSLEQQQQALRDKLKQLRDRLKQRGMQENEGFGDAEQGMEDAESQLGQGSPGDATDGQQRALDGLGKAADGMAQQLQRQMGQGEGEGEGEGSPQGQPGRDQRGRAESRPDPLGRQTPRTSRDFEDNSRGLEDGSGRSQGSINERADRVLKELRRRLGEFERPQEELDYLERLLRQR